MLILAAKEKEKNKEKKFKELVRVKPKKKKKKKKKTKPGNFPWMVFLLRNNQHAFSRACGLGMGPGRGCGLMLNTKPTQLTH